MRRFQFTKFQILVHLGSLVPLTRLIWDFFTDHLTANPIQAATFRTGKAALVLLVLCLACTPLNTVFGFREALKVRRALGLYAFLYVCLHLLIFLVDNALVNGAIDLELVRQATVDKRYALVGLAAFLTLLPLALTSTKGWQKRLGKTWRALHRWVYLAGLLAVIHFVWLVKSDIREPLLYGAVVIFLLLLRIPILRRVASLKHWLSRLEARGSKPADKPKPSSL
jgi:sulfoxide reductase heme-binding subunit YedZ